MSYPRHEALVRPARATSELWRLAVGIVAALALQIFLIQGVIAVLRMGLPGARYFDLMVALNRADGPLGTVLQLLFAGGVGVAALVIARLLHQRDGWTLLGPPGPALAQARAVGWDLLKLQTALMMIWMLLPPDPAPVPQIRAGLDPGLWLALLPVTAAVLLFQTGAEELMFRGYVQSQLAARLAHPAIWMGAPSLVFALLHYAPEIYGVAAWVIVLWAFAFGMAAADLTARAGTLGPAIALHFVNNLFAVAFVAHDLPASGLALYVIPFDPQDSAALLTQLPVDLGLLAVSWLVARLALRA